MSAERIWANSAVAGLVLVAALLIVPGLGDRYLWDDEAETALLAKNVIRFGVPVAWDGASLISQECGSDYDANYLWRQTPWLPIYLTAASLSVFGASAFAARLPFALLGILAVPSMYLLARRLFAARLTALVAAGSLLFSVPFLLHVRQCRYYALAIFAAIWILYFFFTLRRSPRLAAAGLALSLTVLVHTSHLLFFGAVGGLALGFLIVSFDRKVLPWVLAGLIAPSIVNLPWLVGIDLGGQSGPLLTSSSAASFGANLGRYAGRIELYAFSALLLVTALVVVAVATRCRCRSPLPKLARVWFWSSSRSRTCSSSRPSRSSSSGTCSHSYRYSHSFRPGSSRSSPREAGCWPRRFCSLRSSRIEPTSFEGGSR